MAKTAVAAAMLLFITLAFANDSTNLPPEDQDGSGGDDEDMFSGSGYSPIPDVSNAEQTTVPTTVPSSTSVLPTVVTENQHPIVPEPDMTKEEPETMHTTRAAETKMPIAGPNDEMHNTHLSAEQNVTEEHTAVFLEPTRLPAADPDTVQATTSHVIVPDVPNIPQEATAATQATSTTEATEPHKHHHHHNHGHHHEKTTAATVTEAADQHMHHDHHPETTSTQPETTSTVSPDVQHGHVHHAHHPKSDNATEKDSVHLLPTQDSHPLEEETAIEQTTIHVPSHTNESKTNIPVVVFGDETEQDRKEIPDFEGSAVDSDAADFFIDPSIEPAIRKGMVAETGLAEGDGEISETSKGLMEQKGVLAAVIAGGVAGLVLAICLVGFMLYRMKKKDEGSYCLEETKQTNGGYEKPIKQEEFYA